MFKQDLEVVDTLRRDAVNVREPHPSGVKKLQAYAAQLVWIGGKFPIDVRCGCPFLVLSEDLENCCRDANAWVCFRLAPSLRGILPWATTPSGRWSETTSNTSS